ncbi:MAG: signal peptide peptidase SppA [Myxococcales bacterium]|nr:MAG: signal peptide peptidase SppA [Myxococcales bacterium]
MISIQRFAAPIVLLVFVLAGFACSPKINVFPDYTEPLKEVVLEGGGDSKILVVPVTGVLDARPNRGLFWNSPSAVEEIVAMLDKAGRDPDIKAVILQIDTPGGSVTASDILYQEIERYKAKSGAKVVALMMDLAASGGYYVAVASDRIVAHPTTVTGSIGVVFFAANIEGLFDKIGVEAEAIKSGEHKDMASPFRELTDEERAILQAMINEMFDRFVAAVMQGRPMLTEERIRRLADGRIYTAKQAMEWKLIDRIGYTKDAISEAKYLANLKEDASIITYRRRIVADDNIYNTTVSRASGKTPLVDLGLSRFTFVPTTGFYYIWEPGLNTP